jgi:predicted RNA-binding protein with PIN domain
VHKEHWWDPKWTRCGRGELRVNAFWLVEKVNHMRDHIERVDMEEEIRKQKKRCLMSLIW